jgi:hypothetical protein
VGAYFANETLAVKQKLMPPLLPTRAVYRMCGRESYGHGAAEKQNPIPLEYDFVAANEHMDNDIDTATTPQLSWLKVADKFL